jgi:hypothetical protein
VPVFCLSRANLAVPGVHGIRSSLGREQVS